MISFFSKILSPLTKKRLDTLDPKNADEAILVFLDSIKKNLKKYDVPYELVSRIKVYNKLSKKERIFSFPGLYLEIENFLLLQSDHVSKTKQDFRKEINNQHSLLKKLESFNIILLEDHNQKVALSKLFLKDLLLKAKDLLGKFNNPFLQNAEKKLINQDGIIDSFDKSKAFTELKEIYSYSDILHQKLEESLGKNATLNLYSNVYNKHFNNFYLLDSFTATINSVPEELLIIENPNLPSKGQLHKLLRTQISSLEEINNKLSKEILERTYAQNKLMQSQKLYSAVLHNTLDANIIFNIDGIILRLNKKAEMLLNNSDTEYNLYDLLPKKFSKHLKGVIEDPNLNLRALDKKVFEYEVSDKTSETLFYSLKISPIFIDDETLYFCVISNITNEKKNIKLINDAKDIAEKSAQAKTTFLSNMSHEIRTPLNVIQGLTNILESEFESSDEQRENINAIKFSTENLLMIVDDILDFSKIEAGKLNIQNVDFNFKDLITRLQTGFNTKAQEKGILFTINVDKSIPKYIIGDQFRLSQILNNLLSNALKFTNEGEVVLNIKQTNEFEKYISIYFEIRDTGIGISQKQMDHIFNSFYQVTNSHGDKPQGTGLGLAITDHLVSLLGGKLQVDSSVNNGTIFNFKLKYGISHFNQDKSDVKITKVNNHILKGKKILVAEDNKLNQLFIKQLLKKWEADVTLAINGLEAIDQIEKEEFDLILMDIQMPVMGGIEATKKIRSLNSLKSKIPIVACSADVFPESRKKAEEAGINYYITKPVNNETINEILFLLTKN